MTWYFLLFRACSVDRHVDLLRLCFLFPGKRHGEDAVLIDGRDLIGLNLVRDAHQAAERHGPLAVARFLLARGLDGEGAVDDLDADGLAGHAGQLGPNVGVVLVLVEVDGELAALRQPGKAGERGSKQPVDLVFKARSREASAEPEGRGDAEFVGLSVVYESYSDTCPAWAMPAGGPNAFARVPVH